MGNVRTRTATNNPEDWELSLSFVSQNTRRHKHIVGLKEAYDGTYRYLYGARLFHNGWICFNGVSVMYGKEERTGEVKLYSLSREIKSFDIDVTEIENRLYPNNRRDIDAFVEYYGNY